MSGRGSASWVIRGSFSADFWLFLVKSDIIWGSMSRKRKTKNRQKTGKTAAEKPEIVVREVEMGGATDEVAEETATEAETDLDAQGTGDDRGAGGSEKDLDATEAGSELGKKAAGGKLHRINIRYPWLKFLVVLALAAGMLLGGFGMGKVIGDALWETGSSEDTGDVTGGQPEETEQNTEIAEKPAEGPKDSEESEGGSAEEQPQENPVDKPEVTTKPPVTVPPTGGKKLVALTFDDGPSTATTGRLLDVLKAKGVKATFFVVGSMAIRAPELLKREAAEGHEVGGHSAFHQDLSKVSAADLQADVANMDQIFNDVIGHKMEIMRPPYGAVSDVMRNYLGRPMIYWSVDPMDWKYRNAATVRANVVGATFDGAIVLMHDIHSTTVDAVAGIIDDLRAQGYEFLTVSELAAARGIGLTSGVVYYSFKP